MTGIVHDELRLFDLETGLLPPPAVLFLPFIYNPESAG